MEITSTHEVLKVHYPESGLSMRRPGPVSVCRLKGRRAEVWTKEARKAKRGWDLIEAIIPKRTTWDDVMF